MVFFRSVWCKCDKVYDLWHEDVMIIHCVPLFHHYDNVINYIRNNIIHNDLNDNGSGDANGISNDNDHNDTGSGTSNGNVMMESIGKYGKWGKCFQSI